MAWFGRRRGQTAREQAPPPEPEQEPETGGEDGLVDERPVRPVVEPVGEAERSRISAGVAALESSGVDVEDLAALGASYDAAYAAWARERGSGHEVLVEQYAMGIGEHLARRTDMDWSVVTDVFGTDLGLAGGAKGDFVVVPTNLVAGRWMRGETGWVPGVVVHLARRSDQ